MADFVMERDPRARWMTVWLLGTTAIATRQVADGSEPVLLVAHDEDGPPEWQLIGHTDAARDGKIIHLSHAIDRDPTVAEVLDLGPGEHASRHGGTGVWERA